MVYCAPNPATSLVEVLVQIETDSSDLPDPLRYLEIEAPDTISTATADVEPLGRNGHTNLPGTRWVGDEWLRSGQAALLRVPSVIVPATWNVLINPQHPESAQIRIKRVHSHRLDARLQH